MTVRFTAAAAVLATITVLASPAKAGETRTFEAWGHTFTAPDDQALHREAAQADISTAPPRAYASVQAEAGIASAPAIRTQPLRALNVWGARIDVSAD